jgi:hypothetical protein
MGLDQRCGIRSLEMRRLVHLIHAAGLIKNGSGPDRSVLEGSGTDRSG